ncbi:MAG: DNA-directed RNA polymerase subunit omega [Negativicutes bacterium]|nr:DNA-directed RNA polymerase subunit omega [Negativicutes bacterium]
MSRIPSDEIYKHADCKYTACIITAKRARELQKSQPKDSSNKPLLQAYDELMGGELTYRRMNPEELAAAEAGKGRDEALL